MGIWLVPSAEQLPREAISKGPTDQASTGRRSIQVLMAIGASMSGGRCPRNGGYQVVIASRIRIPDPLRRRRRTQAPPPSLTATRRSPIHLIPKHHSHLSTASLDQVAAL